jgi:hypothetical protein
MVSGTMVKDNCEQDNHRNNITLETVDRMKERGRNGVKYQVTQVN